MTSPANPMHAPAAWDVDRYNDLLECAWQSDAMAMQQDRGRATRAGESVEVEAHRALARGLRLEAASVLSRFWDVPRGRPPSAGDSETRSRGFALAVTLHRASPGARSA
jgi:hypothetical protein